MFRVWYEITRTRWAAPTHGTDVKLLAAQTHGTLVESSRQSRLHVLPCFGMVHDACALWYHSMTVYRGMIHRSHLLVFFLVAVTVAVLFLHMRRTGVPDKIGRTRE